jgi:hypothetical protein
MVRHSLTEIIGGRLISDASEIVPTVDDPVRAIDVVEPDGAVYRFSVAESGAWFEECSIVLKGPDGVWTETTSGGSHGDSWGVPWRPSLETLDGHTISIFGSAGMELPYEDDRVVFLRGVYGFADRTVQSLRISDLGTCGGVGLSGRSLRGSGPRRKLGRSARSRLKRRRSRTARYRRLSLKRRASTGQTLRIPPTRSRCLQSQ